MVAIGDIGMRHIGPEKTGDTRYLTPVIHDPDRMADAVIGGKIINGLVVPLPGLDTIVDGIDTPIGQKHIPRLGPYRSHMMDPVGLFVRPGQLMLLYDALLILIHRAPAYKSRLLPAIHHQPVDIVTGLILFYQYPPFYKALQIQSRLVIDFLRMRVHI